MPEIKSASNFSLQRRILHGLTARAFHKAEPQSMAMRLSRFGVRKQVIMVFLGKPQCSRIHGRSPPSRNAVDLPPVPKSAMQGGDELIC